MLGTPGAERWLGLRDEGGRANAAGPRSDSRTKVNVCSQPRSRPLLLLAALGCLLSCLLGARPARAQPYASFQRAQEAWARGEYEEVVRLLEPLVGGEIPSRVIRGDRVLVRESRKYLGAAYVLTGEEAHGREQFEALLRAEGDELAEYDLESAIFPSEVHEVFDAVRERLLREREARREAREARERAAETRRRAALLDLVALAQTDEVEVEHDPLLAWVPFGAGQFQNGNEGLGWFFAVGQATALALSFASLAAWLPLEEQYACARGFECAPPDTGLLRTFHVSTFVFGGAFVALAVAGIVEAHLSFVPSHTVRRERPVPESILEDLELAVSPTGVSLRLTFW